MFIFIADHSRGDGTSVGHWRPSYKVVLAASFQVEKAPGDYEDQKINGHLGTLPLSRFSFAPFKIPAVGFPARLVSSKLWRWIEWISSLALRQRMR
jgi:hypothetical protein